MRIKISTLQKIIAEALENAYDVLGLQPGASTREIKAAWTRLVLAARQARGSGRVGIQADEINMYGRAVRAVLAHERGEAEDAMFEPRAVKPPPETKPAAMGRVARTPKAAELDAADAANPLMDPSDAVAIRKRKAKADYKVYGGRHGKDKQDRSAVRVQGKLYGTGPGGVLSNGDKTMFGHGDRVYVDNSAELDGRLRVSDGGHDQVWDAVDEVRKVVDKLVIESLIRAAR